MPKSAQPGAKKAIQGIYNAEGKQHAQAAIKTLAQLYGAKFLTHGRPGHGLQARGVRPAAVAGRERTPSRHPRPGRCPL
ncbi:MAG: hypothetical protein JF597_19055 [Streptomyces sp.]|nr:hypothetical protein [Streptomyces sp.]